MSKGFTFSQLYTENKTFAIGFSVGESTTVHVGLERRHTHTHTPARHDRGDILRSLVDFWGAELGRRDDVCLQCASKALWVSYTPALLVWGSCILSLRACTAVQCCEKNTDIGSLSYNVKTFVGVLFHEKRSDPTFNTQSELHNLLCSKICHHALPIMSSEFIGDKFERVSDPATAAPRGPSCLQDINVLW